VIYQNQNMIKLTSYQRFNHSRTSFYSNLVEADLWNYLEESNRIYFQFAVYVDWNL